ncbi:AAA family ATPase [Clostridium sp. 19966]|uniref:ATP-binding protein n=1 Tax=Clostridium sp. 19966 TaxID=2768166 RepID=UPI0028DDE957|nr:AAA family ATPase [Clostridium sp. 19966]MDT8717919.1 AAA family ATPase [Clostridium sp. 19966]
MDKSKVLKPTVEILYKDQLEALKNSDKGPKPMNWQLSPKSIRAFILGMDKPLEYEGRKVKITRKFYGDDTLIERCIITLAGNRGLMLVGEPGTAKTMLSELLSAAICGCSTNTVQGTAGSTEDMIKYTWNYAMLLAKGPVSEALVPSPLYIGMKKGMITRFEEITRCPQEIQDSLISILSDKIITVPELGDEGIIMASPGFNVIATANTRDRGVNEMSSALKRRFNFETIFPINDVKLEAKIIEGEVEKLLRDSNVDIDIDRDAAEILATTFHELREGISSEGYRIDKPASVMSTAEAVSVYYQTVMSSFYYGDSKVSMDSMVQNLLGSVLKESREDIDKLKSYFNVVVKAKSNGDSRWKGYYDARKWVR